MRCPGSGMIIYVCMMCDGAECYQALWVINWVVVFVCELLPCCRQCGLVAAEEVTRRSLAARHISTTSMQATIAGV